VWIYRFYCLFVCVRFLCICTVTDFSAEDKPIDAQGRESPIFVNFAPPEAHAKPSNWRARGPHPRVHNDYPLAAEHMTDVGSACVNVNATDVSSCFSVLFLYLYDEKVEYYDMTKL